MEQNLNKYALISKLGYIPSELKFSICDYCKPNCWGFTALCKFNYWCKISWKLHFLRESHLNIACYCYWSNGGIKVLFFGPNYCLALLIKNCLNRDWFDYHIYSVSIGRLNLVFIWRHVKLDIDCIVSWRWICHRVNLKNVGLLIVLNRRSITNINWYLNAWFFTFNSAMLIPTKRGLDAYLED